MKRLLLFALLLSIGCGPGPVTPPTPPVLQHMEITIGSNGNPSVPPCQTKLVDCVSSLQVLDKTTGVSYSIAPTATSYLAPGATDTFEVRVTGYDGSGTLITSTYVLVPLKTAEGITWTAHKKK